MFKAALVLGLLVCTAFAVSPINNVKSDLTRLISDIREIEESQQAALAVGLGSRTGPGNSVPVVGAGGASAPTTGKVIALLDVGSSGTKIIYGAATDAGIRAPEDGEKSALKTKLNDAVKGLAAVVTNQNDGGSAIVAQWELGKTMKPAGSVATTAQYMDLIFQEISLDMSNNRPRAGDYIVKMLATAGMRKVPKASNDAAWGGVCNKNKRIAGVNYKTDQQGPNCGTIPGVTEAYFEWYGTNIMEAGQGHGIMSKGGASAQIAVAVEKDVFDAWKQYVDGGNSAAQTEIDAYAELPNFFNNKKYMDFVGYKVAADVTNFATMSGLNTPDTGGLILISYLGVPHKIDPQLSPGRDAGAKTNFWAGGLDTDNALIQSLQESDQANCGDGKKWDTCKKAYAKALCSDKIFAETITFLREKKLYKQKWAAISNVSPERISKSDCYKNGWNHDCMNTLLSDINSECDGKNVKDAFGDRPAHSWGNPSFPETCAKSYARAFFAMALLGKTGLKDLDNSCAAMAGSDGEQGQWAQVDAPDWTIGCAAIDLNGKDVAQLKLARTSTTHPTVSLLA